MARPRRTMKTFLLLFLVACLGCAHALSDPNAHNSGVLVPHDDIVNEDELPVPDLRGLEPISRHDVYKPTNVAGIKPPSKKEIEKLKKQIEESKDKTEKENEIVQAPTQGEGLVDPYDKAGIDPNQQPDTVTPAKEDMYDPPVDKPVKRSNLPDIHKKEQSESTQKKQESEESTQQEDIPDEDESSIAEKPKSIVPKQATPSTAESKSDASDESVSSPSGVAGKPEKNYTIIILVSASVLLGVALFVYLAMRMKKKE